MQRIALGISYNGALWQGWQTQPHGQTVQDTLELALNRFAASSQPIQTVCAGRTDSGVHAVNQVVHCDVSITRSEESWVRGVNAFLPPSIAVNWASSVSTDFHARFSARSRTYVYVLCRDRVRPALWAGQVGWCFQPLDVDLMRQGAELLLGEHDFSSFRSSQCQAKSPIRTMHQLTIAEHGSMLLFTLKANAFLHHMVRNIMGALVQIGQKRQSLDWLRHVLSACDRTQGAPTFAPDGLYLLSVDYGEDYPMINTSVAHWPPLLTTQFQQG